MVMSDEVKQTNFNLVVNNPFPTYGPSETWLVYEMMFDHQIAETLALTPLYSLPNHHEWMNVIRGTMPLVAHKRCDSTNDLRNVTIIATTNDLRNVVIHLRNIGIHEKTREVENTKKLTREHENDLHSLLHKKKVTIMTAENIVMVNRRRMNDQENIIMITTLEENILAIRKIIKRESNGLAP
uniref:Uncharacterized protein n=1 Tax=Romanomermis culicivorax TaxID=13658 RepID=A0A915JBU2_ROMCU